MTGKAAADGRVRLDELLLRRGLYGSRSRARDAIERATVRVAGEVATKPGLAVAPNSAIDIQDPGARYVSRAALKLIAGLDHFGIDLRGRLCLDIGASTGGFTQVLLERGAARVIAIDVGHGQMTDQLRNDPLVELVERLNARDLDAAQLNDRAPDIVVCDVSFISLRLALPAALALAAPGASGVFLVKPQFEAGREAIGKGGVLRDLDSATAVAEDMSAWLDSMSGWHSLGLCASPIDGADGNREFLLGGRKAG